MEKNNQTDEEEKEVEVMEFVLDNEEKLRSNIKLAKEADIFICEATYKSDMQDKATEYKHMTAKEAAQLANQAQVIKLYLTHFSARYNLGLTDLNDDPDFLLFLTVSFLGLRGLRLTAVPVILHVVAVLG